MLAAVFGRRLIRLQCYEGIDTNQALYEWDYARQMLQIRALSEHQLADDDAVDKLFGPKFLLERPLLEAVRAGDRAVLLIDEVDRADDEFEAFLLELLSDFQITHPRDRHHRAPSTPPLVVLTSNRTRELHDALKRRCLYHWVGYPTRRARGGDRPGPGAGRVRGAGPQGGRRGQPAARARPGQAARASPRRIDWVRTLDVLGDDRPGRPASPTTRWARSSRTATTSSWCATTWRRSPPVPERRRPFVARAGRLRARAARRRARRRLRRRADLLRGHGHARPDRPARPVLGRPHHAGHPARPDPRRTTGCSGGSSSTRRDALARAAAAHASRRGAEAQVGAARSRRPSPATDERGAAGRAGPGGLRRGRRCRHKAFAACTPEELAALRRIMRPDPADPAAPPHPAHRAGRATAARPTCAAPSARPCALHGEPAELYWRRRRLRHAAADPDPRRLRLDGRLLAQPAAVRATRPARGRAGSRCSASAPGSPGSPGRSSAAGPTTRSTGPPTAVFDWEGGTRIGDSLDDVRARLGPARAVPRRHRGDLLRRARPRRPRSAGRGDGAAVPAVPPDRLAEPAQGRRRGLPAEHARA